MAAINQQFKLTKFAKDLGLKSKDLVEILADNGIEAKSTQKALEPAEFDILFDTLTKANQITNIGDYLDGVTHIPSKPKKAAAKKAEAPAEPEKVEKAAEKAPEKQPEAAKTAEKEPAKESSAEKPMKKAPAAAEKAEEKKEAPKAAENRPQNVEAPKKEEPNTQAKQPAARQEAADTGVKKPAARQPYTGNPYHPQGGGSATPFNPRAAAPAQQGSPRFERPDNRQGGQNHSQRSAPSAGGAQQGSSRFERPDNRQGFGAPQGAGRFDARPDSRQAPGNHRAGGPQGNRPQGNRFDRGMGADKGDFVQNAPRETFKAQPIVRGASTNLNPDGTRKGPRVIDTRTSSVDLSKYDERLDNFVSDSDAKLQGGNQKLKKGANNAQSKQNASAQNNRFGGKGGKNNRRGQQAAPAAPVVTHKPTAVELPEEIVVGQLASKLHVTAGEVVKKLMMMGMMATINQSIDYDTAALVADEFGITASPEVVVSIEEKLFDEAEDTEEQLITRAPVVCVMGHVDHGKTSILDAIRNANVTAGEAGGITQHIGAYRVKAGGRDITFLDTPGHAAFTAMRARGAMATDIAILVVAADDGVMPQTVEAINHAKAANIDIVVAINKMDKPTANPDAIKQELTKYGLVPEEWGGDAICVPVSALTHQGIDDLLESVLLVADVKELKANPNRRAKGLVIEAKLDRGRGPVATVLVQNGTLHSGDIIIAGTAVGHVRSMTDHNGRTLKEAAPSVPVEITGLSEVPSAGDEFQVVEDERMARTLADQRRDRAKEDVFKANARANLNDLFAQISDGVKDLNVIVKADVDGSVEAVKASLVKLSNEEVKVRVIHAAAGGITEGDVTFAAASNAIIVGFNVRPDKSAIDSAERQNVEIRTYRVIYECIEEIQAAMRGMLAPKFRENLLGHAEVRQTIHVPNVGTIAGSYIQDGKITRQSQIRVVRDGIVIFEDKISSLKRFKDDVREVASGYECGVGLEKFNDIKVGDVLEAFIMEQIQPE
ncbi:MAG: translation initiation factor IF-2 [Ruminococcaceae bacterium]|nr:translation initiation factor IF-2 [Oscillospiraceae bacterium]